MRLCIGASMHFKTLQLRPIACFLLWVHLGPPATLHDVVEKALDALREDGRFALLCVTVAAMPAQAEVLSLADCISGSPDPSQHACYELSVDEIAALEAAANALHPLCIEAADAVIQRGWWDRLGIPAAAVPAILQSWERDDFSVYLDGAELMNPMTQLRGDDEIYNFFKYITDRSDLGICLYRTPVSGKEGGNRHGR